MTLRCTTSGEWECLPVSEALYTAGLCPIKEYIQQIQATVAVQVTCRLIYELFIGAERVWGTSRFMQWCYQDVKR